eukprot:g6324.t1
MVCAKCSTKRKVLPGQGEVPVRVCDKCFEFNEDLAQKVKRVDMAVLLKGQVFLKHGRRGKPHERLVFFDEVRDTLLYGKPQAGGGTGFDGECKSFPIDSIHRVERGKVTPILMRDKTPGTENVCFAILAKGTIEADKASLDLQAPSEAICKRWVSALTDVLEYRKQVPPEQRRREQDKLRAQAEEFAAQKERRKARLAKAEEIRNKYRS